MTKKELELKVKTLEEALSTIPRGNSISDVSIDMSKPDETKLAIANAVSEGMKALQSLAEDQSNSYGIYISSGNEL